MINTKTRYNATVLGEEKEMVFECDKSNFSDDFSITAEGYNVESKAVLKFAMKGDF